MNEWLKIKEFSELVDVTEQSIYQRLKKKDNPLLKYFKEENGVKLINRQAAYELYNYKEPAEGSDTEEAAAAAETDPTHQKLLKVYEREIEILSKELEEKNKQIDQLNQRLEDQIKILENEQKLALMDKQKLLELEAKYENVEEPKPPEEEKSDPEQPENKEPVKKSFWQRIFG